MGTVGTNMPVKAVLFDLDGTLIDTEELLLVSMRYATRTVLGRKIPDEKLMSLVGQPLRTQMEDLDPGHVEELIDTYRDYCMDIHDEMTREFPGVGEMLHDLGALGVRMGVVTSKMHNFAMQGLNLFGYGACFDVVVGPDDCEGHKPDPEPVIFAAGRLGLPTGECLYVGDSPFDIEAGNRAGCRTIDVLWGMFPKDVLRAQHPTFEAEAPSDVTDIVRALVRET